MFTVAIFLLVLYRGFFLGNIANVLFNRYWKEDTLVSHKASVEWFFLQADNQLIETNTKSFFFNHWVLFKLWVEEDTDIANGGSIDSKLILFAADQLFERKNYSQAVKLYESISTFKLTEEISRSYTYYRIGRIHQLEGNSDQAWFFYEQARESADFESEWVEEDFYIQRGLILAKQDRWHEAVREYEAAYVMNPNSFRNQFFLANAQYQIGNLIESEKLAKQSIDSDASFPGPYIVLGFIYRDRNELILAEKMFEKALQVDPTNYTAQKALEEVQP